MNIDTIDDLLKWQIIWTNNPNAPGWRVLVNGEECRLVMNDFPDEPLYTLIWRDQRLDFDSDPQSWSIPYS